MSEELDAAERAAKANREARPLSLEGETVVRPAATNAATIHDFLHHLRGEGILGVPEVLQLGERTETLRLIVGDSGGDGWRHQHTDEGLASAARFLRRIHDASTSWMPPPDAEWGAPPELAKNGEDLVFCHGDPGPWNFVWQDRHAVGLIDWDFLHPAPRISDVAYALQWFVPLRRDEHALEWHHFPEVPDRRHRVEVFLEAYGDLPPFDVAEAVANRMQEVSDLVKSLAEAGHEPQRTWVADGALEVDAHEIGWVREHRSEFT